MSEGVKKSLMRTLKRFRDTRESEAEKILDDLKLDNRYVEEIFGGYA